MGRHYASGGRDAPAADRRAGGVERARRARLGSRPRHQPAVRPGGIGGARFLRTAGGVHRPRAAGTHFRTGGAGARRRPAAGPGDRTERARSGVEPRHCHHHVDDRAESPTAGSADTRTPGQPRVSVVAKYLLNQRAVDQAKKLIDAEQYVLDSDWGDVQPDAAAQNAYLESHGWDDYAAWHLGLTDGAKDETKARYAFVYRAAEWRHKDVEIAAHDLLQHLDATSG